MAYSKNAFNCAKCPGKAGDGGCPMWWKTVWTQPSAAGPEAVKVIESCGYEQLPQFLIEVIKASNRPAAAVESARDEIATGLLKIAESCRLRPEGVALIAEAGRRLAIENHPKPS